jgi:hypothetical protein
VISPYIAEINSVLASKGVAIRGVPIVALLGEEFVAQHGANPRVVVYPVSDEIRPAMQAAGNNPRALYTRVCSLEWELWGGDYTEVEALMQCLLHVIHEVTRGASEVQGGDWDRETLDDQWGRKFRLRTSFFVPITDRRYGEFFPYTERCGDVLEAGGAPAMTDPLNFETTLVELDASALITGRFRTP